MNWQTYKIELITPCFCAGADQSQAEIRVPSIRGQLRWWFRALGGTRAEEQQIFGGVHGDTTSSAVILRVANVTKGQEWKMFPMGINDSGTYIWYFASVADGKKRWWINGQKGKNNNNMEGHLPPDTYFDLNIGFRRSLDGKHHDKFMRAFESFCRFGGIGMRATRGMGAICCPSHYFGNINEYKQSATTLFKDTGFTARWGDTRFGTWQAAIFDAEKWLRNDLRKEYNAKKQPNSPLGSDRPRQTSAVYFRPVKCKDGYFLLIFEAPHNRVLAPNSRRPSPIIQNRSFGGTAPVNTEKRHYHR